jgi:hypoxanthine phosphoribosyltransferase
MILFTEKEIQDKVKEIADRINKIEHEQPPVYVCVLNGAFMFFTDLVKQLGECEIDFIRAKSYTGTQQGSVSITKNVETNITGKDVYLIDDIYDSGTTIKALIASLKTYNPKSITPVTLFKKDYSHYKDLIYGFELTNEHWLVGYGLDDVYGLQRTLSHVRGIPAED